MPKRGLESALISLAWGGMDAPSLLSGIETIHDGPRMNSIAVEAFGRHLEGADASASFSFGGFSEIPEKLRERSELIPFLYPLGVSAEFSKHMRSGLRRKNGSNRWFVN